VRHLLLAAAAAAAVAATARAGGIDLSGQPVTLLFHDGDYAELSFAATRPTIEGSDPAGAASGSVYGTVSDIGAGVLRQLGQGWSAALVVDRPYGVRVDYDPDLTAFPFAGTHAEPSSLALTGLLRYRIDPRWSVHAGLRAQRFGGEATLDGWGYGTLAGYEWTGDPDWGFGYVVGGAFEIPEIALRVALTYGSEIDHELEASENFFGPTTTEVTMPQSVNLDIQTGIAPKTLAYGLVRWVNWAGWKVEPAGLYAATGLPLIEFDSDAFTYRLGIARQLTDAVAAAVEVTHETAKNQTTTALDPYDGFTTLGLGGSYTHPSGLEIGAGVGYSWLGDATAVLPTGASATFADNHAVSARLRIGFSF
jgi:long-subunit fatty acid transport protein